MRHPLVDGGRTGVDDVGWKRVTGERVSVAVVSSRIQGELIVGFLRSHDLRAAVVTDDAGGQEPQWQLNGVHVVVPVSDERLARELLADVDDTAAPEGRG